MTTRVDVEEIETTRGEALLSVVLATFTLVGLLWVYFNVDVERDFGFRPPEASLSAADRSALDRAARARDELAAARDREADRRRQLADRREEYRTALDAGARDPALERRYEAAQAGYESAQARTRAAARTRADATPRAREVRGRLAAAARREQARIDRQERHDGRVSFARRLALVLLALAASYVLLGRLRRRRSRYLPMGMSVVAAVALLGFVMGIDYLEDYVEITDLGVLVLSAVGALMTLAAFAALQRYLAKRTPYRRARKGECPFCGYPARGTSHCEGCGRDVVAECSTCSAARRVGTRFCGACGSP